MADFTKVKWGDGLSVTDEGSGVIRVDSGGGGAGLLFPPFSVAGTLSIRSGGLRWYAPAAGTIKQVHSAVGTPSAGGGVGVSVNLLKNGSMVVALTIGNGLYTAQQDVSIPFAAGDYFTVNVTAVGLTTPGADLVVQPRL